MYHWFTPRDNYGRGSSPPYWLERSIISYGGSAYDLHSALICDLELAPRTLPALDWRTSCRTIRAIAGHGLLQSWRAGFSVPDGHILLRRHIL